jgi:hypothetical protein
VKIGLIGDTHVPGLSPVLSAYIETAFSGLDIILHYVKMHGNILLFNPRAAVAVPGHRPSVGVLNVGARNITGKIVYL